MIRRSSVRPAARFRRVAAGAAAVILLAGCQAIFTYSPLSGLKQNPADMTPAQRLTYAQDALASGDTATMKTAYDAIKNDTSGDAQYTAAQLGIEISGVPTVLRTIATDTSSVSSQLSSINDFITANHLDPTYMVAAEPQLAAAAAAGLPLTDTDRAMGAIGLLLQGAMTQNGNWNIVAGNPQKTAASNFLADAVTDVQSLSSSDPQRQFIETLNTY
ncbi:MAG TPA: hypothetical protein VFI08_09330, partial [Spirochaetia bacterium]|nr:hypothetical protein [Spirochaetia bacterium]